MYIYFVAQSSVQRYNEIVSSNWNQLIRSISYFFMSKLCRYIFIAFYRRIFFNEF